MVSEQSANQFFRIWGDLDFMFVTLVVSCNQFNMLQLTNDLSELHRLIKSFTFFMFVSFGTL